MQMLTITGTVGASGKYDITSIPVKTAINTVLKITFENNTSGTNLQLCAGDPPLVLNSSGGPGYKFLTIIDTNSINGKMLYVRRAVGTAPSQFTLNIE